MVGSDIGDINSPTHAGSRPTRVDRKLFGKPSPVNWCSCASVVIFSNSGCDFSGDSGTSSGYFVTGVVSSTIQLRSGWTTQRMHLENLGKRSRIPERRTQSVVHESGHGVQERGSGCGENCDSQVWLESWRKLSKEYRATTGTSLHEYTNLLEYDFGTTWIQEGENQIVDFQKATGEVFSDRLKCAIVLSRSRAPIRTYLRVQNRGDYGALRVALMNYLEAEDDGHGPVPMEVGSMKGKKGDRGKKGYRKGKFGKSFGKYDKSNEHSKINDYGKGSEKGKERGKKGKEKGQGKDEKPAPNSGFQGYCRSCGKW